MKISEAIELIEERDELEFERLDVKYFGDSGRPNARAESAPDVEEEITPMDISGGKLNAGTSFCLVANPPRIDEGSTKPPLFNDDRVLREGLAVLRAGIEKRDVDTPFCGELSKAGGGLKPSAED